MSAFFSLFFSLDGLNNKLINKTVPEYFTVLANICFWGFLFAYPLSLAAEKVFDESLFAAGKNLMYFVLLYAAASAGFSSHNETFSWHYFILITFAVFWRIAILAFVVSLSLVLWGSLLHIPFQEVDDMYRFAGIIVSFESMIMVAHAIAVGVSISYVLSSKKNLQ